MTGPSPCRNRRAFTLVEIMVVIVIIGLLAAIAIPVISAFGNRAKERLILQNLRLLSDAAQVYFMESMSNEARLADLVGEGRFIRNLDPVAGEEYPLIILYEDTFIVATGAVFGDVVYDVR
ncbi:MAG: prepilin-type N-terminal cleavage/methylation domain-containing protein [Opitutales bacterium]|nr:prepilin-type N-terminal cleavage/methylation domain-containing protein [Opitutales bacterium]